MERCDELLEQVILKFAEDTREFTGDYFVIRYRGRSYFVNQSIGEVYYV